MTPRDSVSVFKTGIPQSRKADLNHVPIVKDEDKNLNKGKQKHKCRAKSGKTKHKNHFHRILEVVSHIRADALPAI